MQVRDTGGNLSGDTAMKPCSAIPFLILFTLIPATLVEGQPVTESATRYTIDSSNSILRVYVGRAGILARLGHNHVIHTRSLAGEIVVAENLAESRARMSFPVDSLVVDAADERERAGADFDSQPGESAIEGTRNNMLGDSVLAASSYPDISVSVTTLSIADAEWQLAVELELKGSTFNLEIPARVVIDATSAVVDASFTLDHEEIGLSPFSAIGGSLRVAEAIDFDIHVEASR